MRFRLVPADLMSGVSRGMLRNRLRNEPKPKYYNNIMINIEIPKERTFELPEGKFSAEITSLKVTQRPTHKGRQEWIRLLFKVRVPGKDHLECSAGKNFLLSFDRGSELRSFLSGLLGADFFTRNSSQKIDLEAVLLGMKGEITLSHFQGRGFETPLVNVEAFEQIKVPVQPGGKS